MSETLVLETSSMVIIKLEDAVGKKVKLTFKSKKTETSRNLKGVVIQTDRGFFLEAKDGKCHPVNHSELTNIQLLPQ